MKKIHAVVLKEVVIVEEDGEFKEVCLSEKKVPLYLTNYALKQGRDSGLLDSGMIAEVINIQESIRGKEQEEAAIETIKNLPEDKMLSVIYLAFVGANPRTEYSLDDFLKLYHGNYYETLRLYIEIMTASINDSDNKFAAGLRKSTKKPSSKEKKSNLHS